LVVIFFPVAASSKSVFGTGTVTVRLGCPPASDDGGESVVLCRGRMALDRVAEAIRANPFRVVVLDGVDHADNVVQGSVIRAIESGRLADSRGRDVALGSNILVVMLPSPERSAGAWSTGLGSASQSGSLKEKKTGRAQGHAKSHPHASRSPWT